MDREERRTRCESATAALQKAFRGGNLAFYLGAGVSAASGLPTWEKLVAAMYFSALSDDSDQRVIRKAFRNYLLAIAEWHLKQNAEPMDITARKIELSYEDRSKAFLEALHDTLYIALWSRGRKPTDAELRKHLDGNATLKAVARLCAERSKLQPDRFGVPAVVTYNYDDLLERMLGTDRPHRSFFRASPKMRAGQLPHPSRPRLRALRRNRWVSRAKPRVHRGPVSLTGEQAVPLVERRADQDDVEHRRLDGGDAPGTRSSRTDATILLFRFASHGTRKKETQPCRSRESSRARAERGRRENGDDDKR